MRIQCPSCPDGNEWSANGPTGRACPTCGGKAYIEGVKTKKAGHVAKQVDKNKAAYHGDIDGDFDYW